MTARITKSIIVKQDISHIYQLWSNFENFPHFMKYIRSVEKVADNKSRWKLDAPLGQTIIWEAEMTRSEPNKRIAWNSKDHDGTITTSGQVTFNSLPKNEVEITVTVQYNAPSGRLGELAARLINEPEKSLETDLRNFKQYAEGMADRIETDS